MAPGRNDEGEDVCGRHAYGGVLCLSKWVIPVGDHQPAQPPGHLRLAWSDLQYSCRPLGAFPHRTVRAHSTTLLTGRLDCEVVRVKESGQMTTRDTVVLLMGVSVSGKSTVGVGLARPLTWITRSI